MPLRSAGITTRTSNFHVSSSLDRVSPAGYQAWSTRFSHSSVEQLTSSVTLLHMQWNNYIFSEAKACVIKKLKSIDGLCFLPQSSVQKATLPAVTTLCVHSSRTPLYLTDLTLQQRNLARPEVFLLYLTLLWNTRSASNDSAAPVTNAFLPSFPPTHIRKPTTKFQFRNALFCQKDLCCYNQHTGRMENTWRRIYTVKKKIVLKTGRVQSL